MEPHKEKIVTDEEKQVRTLFLTYSASDDAAETFMIVLGSISENFRDIDVIEFQDDTVFADGENAMTALHEMATNKSRLTPDQLLILDEFSQKLNEWKGQA